MALSDLELLKISIESFLRMNASSTANAQTRALEGDDFASGYWTGFKTGLNGEKDSLDILLGDVNKLIEKANKKPKSKPGRKPAQ
ncbi:hypothetical protein GCM10028807_17700 [Spirosoma daeguense]